MKNIKKLFFMTVRYWKLMISGVITTLIFAALSSISLGMTVPLFDYVFGLMHKDNTYNTFGEFYNRFYSSTAQFFSQSDFSDLFSSEHLGLLLESYKDLLSHTDQMLLLFLIGITMIILIVIKNSFYYVNRIIFATLRGKVIYQLRNKLFRKYLDLSLTFFRKITIGDSQVRLTSDANIVSNLFIRSFFGSLRDVALIIVNVTIALLINCKLFLYTAVIVPVVSILISFLGKKVKKYSKRIQKIYGILFSKIEEVFNGFKIVKSFSKEDFEFKRFITHNFKFYKSWRRAQIYQALSVPLSEINGTLVGIVVLIIGGKMVLDNPTEFTFGSFMFFMLAVFSILHPVKNITKAYIEIKKAMVSLERIYEVLDTVSEISERPDAVSISEFKDSIKISSLRFSYNNDGNVLSDINIEIKKGEQIALVGSSGSGKTTLVNLIERFYNPDEGIIAIDGINIKDIKISDLHNLFGTVTQESILFNDTIFNNISYGSNKKVSAEDVKKAARIAYADEFIDKLPAGYDTLLSPKGSNLSGGQKQRLCIARAIVGDPPILIFDEATSALDSESEKNVQKAIDRATKDRTVIVIAHRLSTILNSDRIVVMEDGRILEIGT
ncbi:MAG TPA: ABC transporter ATP-binding protein, partial [Candidatus Krumholzibacteriaceae bacterium]|nr:ABC transporter ATP-binding protein [Candidatus Krumholzibacteriaceae bacterium]